MSIGVIGRGAFGKALVYVLHKNRHTPECVERGEQFSRAHDVLFIAVPVAYIRSALKEHSQGYTKDSLIVNCAKGIELETGKLPQEIIQADTKCERYAVLTGPSFANEILEDIPTVVDVAVTVASDGKLIQKLLAGTVFLVEVHNDIFELELSGAMKNIYAIAAGFIAGSGGGENTRAHMQVVALREYTKLIHVLEKNDSVVRPGVVGDLILTCASKESRNYRYGYQLAREEEVGNETVEGSHSVKAIGILTKRHNITLPLAEAVCSLVSGSSEGKTRLYRALGF